MKRRVAAVACAAMLIAALAGDTALSKSGKYDHGDLPNPTKRPNAEPGIAIDGKGRIWATSLFAGQPPAPPNFLDTATPGSGLWMSNDGGLTYEWMGDPTRITPEGTPPASFSGGDSDIAAAVEPNEYGEYNVYATGLHLSENSIVVSQDGGKTWIRNPIASLPGPVDRPWIAADGSCTAYLAYAAPGGWWINRYEFCTPPSAGISKEPESSVKVTPDGGRTITNARAGKLIVDTSLESPFRHRIYMALETCTGSVDDLVDGFFEPEEGNGGCPKVPSIVVVYSSDRGETWQTSKVAEVPNRAMPIWPTTMASDEEGNVYVAWHDNHDSFISISEDGGESWSEPQQVNDPGTTAVYPTVAARTKGDVVVAWYGTERDGDANDEEVMGPAGEETSAPWALYLARSHNLGHVFQDEVIDPLVHFGVLCTRGTGCPNADRSRALLDNFGVVMLDDGRAAIAYTSDQPGGTRAVARTRYATEL